MAVTKKEKPSPDKHIRCLRWCDALLLGAILLTAITLLLCHRSCFGAGREAIVRVDGTEIWRIRLDTPDAAYTVETNYGKYQVAVRNGRISVTAAPCPDRICVQHQPTDTIGDSIVCLPGRLTITIEDGNSNGQIILPQEDTP